MQAASDLHRGRPLPYGPPSASSEASAKRRSLWRTPRTRALLFLGTVGGAGGLVALAAHVYTELLWFRELGHEDVYWTTLKWQLLAKGVVGLGAVAAVLVNFVVVDRVMARHAELTAPRRVALLWGNRRLLYPLVAIACGLASSARWPDVAWQHLLLWAHRSEFGATDPLFHRDLGFFVFSLPVYREVSAWLLETIVLAAVTTLAAYLLAGGLHLARPLAMLRAARAHLLALAALLLLVLAWRLRLDQFTLAVPHRGTALPGASYTDVHVRLPALRILTALSLVASVLCVYVAVARKLPIRTFGLVVAIGALTLVAKHELPALVERFGVDPHQLSRERPYIARAIVSTRHAYGLDRIKVQSLPAADAVTAEELAENRSTIENLSVWDSELLGSTMNELESIGSYYTFGAPTVDRYTIGGVERLMTIAPRELDLSRLDKASRSWANERFAYTHGYGVVGIGATGVDAERFPHFEQREFGARGNPLGVRQPRIYYGERRTTAPYLIVPSNRGEVEGPTPATRSSRYHYDGSGGIALSNLLRRAAFAARFGDLKLLLSDTVNERSRIVLRRNVRDRVVTLAPFLTWDKRPQTVVVDGRITYLFHGYTTSDDYPYAASVRFGGKRVNYVREAARAAVDAFTGRVTVYTADDADPIARAWQAAYPGLFVPGARMPPELRAHLRYPRELFAIQMRVYETYHADDVTAFWTGSDAWQRPLQLAGPVESAGELHFPDPERALDSDEREEGNVTADVWRMRPGYYLARLPGEGGERFLLATPFTPHGRHNLVGYAAGSVDGNGRLQIDVLSLPRDRLTIGPAQATRRILASPEVNSRLELLNRESRDLGKAAVLRTVLGAPRVVPLGRQLVMVQPVYATAAGDGVPRLALVAVHANGRVGYGPDLKTALRQVLDDEARGPASGADSVPTPARLRRGP